MTFGELFQEVDKFQTSVEKTVCFDKLYMESHISKMEIMAHGSRAFGVLKKEMLARLAEKLVEYVDFEEIESPTKNMTKMMATLMVAKKGQLPPDGRVRVPLPPKMPCEAWGEEPPFPAWGEGPIVSEKPKGPAWYVELVEESEA